MGKRAPCDQERASLRTYIDDIDALERYREAVPEGDRDFMLALLRRPDSPEPVSDRRVPEQVVAGLAGPTTLRWDDPELQSLYEAIFRERES